MTRVSFQTTSRFYSTTKNNLKQLLKTQEEEQRESQRRFANQTAQNVTFLLDHLLQQYDNSLRPDIRG